MFAFLTLAMAACLAVGTSCGGGGDSSSGNTPSSSEQDSAVIVRLCERHAVRFV